MAVLDERPGRHAAYTVRAAGNENACHCDGSRIELEWSATHGHSRIPEDLYIDGFAKDGKSLIVVSLKFGQAMSLSVSVHHLEEDIARA